MSRDDILFALGVRMSELVKSVSGEELSFEAEAEIDRIVEWVDINFPEID